MNININEHYLAFKWAVSKDWQDKNELYKQIQYKIQIVTEHYDLAERDIIDELFSNYWERKHYTKYDETKGSLYNWIAGYVNLYLNHVIRRCSVRQKNTPEQRIDPIDPRNQANLVYLDRDNEKEDPDYQPDIVIDPTNPEDLLIQKEVVEFAKGHFSQTEIDYLMDEIDLTEAASISGISCDAFRKRLDRRIKDFIRAMEVIDKN